MILGFSSLVLIGLSLSGIRNYIEIACILIFMATLVDVCDGKVARRLGTSGDFGKQIDSLADIVSFCLVPSFLIFYYSYELIRLDLLSLILISSLPLVFGAIRLAKFNAYSVQSDGSHYLGLPTPANAIFICSSILFYYQLSNVLLLEGLYSSLFIFDFFKKVLFKFYISSENVVIIVCSISSFLLVSNIKYSKFPKVSFSGDKDNIKNIFGLLIFSTFLFIGIIIKEYQIVMLFFISYYIISGILKALISKISGGV